MITEFPLEDAKWDPDDEIEMAKAYLAEQDAKADAGKPRLTLVPRQMIWDIAEVREFGLKKYQDPDNWRTVSLERLRNAAYRHFLMYLDNPKGKDEESGLEHYKHLMCNLAFIAELEKEN